LKHFTGKGGKNRRKGKSSGDTMKRTLPYKEEGQEYAAVLTMLGNGRLRALCVGMSFCFRIFVLLHSCYFPFSVSPFEAGGITLVME
jgi:hypothetical protein